MKLLQVLLQLLVPLGLLQCLCLLVLVQFSLLGALCSPCPELHPILILALLYHTNLVEC